MTVKTHAGDKSLPSDRDEHRSQVRVQWLCAHPRQRNEMKVTSTA